MGHYWAIQIGPDVTESFNTMTTLESKRPALTLRFVVGLAASKFQLSLRTKDWQNPPPASYGMFVNTHLQKSFLAV